MSSSPPTTGLSVELTTRLSTQIKNPGAFVVRQTSREREPMEPDCGIRTDATVQSALAPRGLRSGQRRTPGAEGSEDRYRQNSTQAKCQPPIDCLPVPSPSRTFPGTDPRSFETRARKTAIVATPPARGAPA